MKIGQSIGAFLQNKMGIKFPKGFNKRSVTNDKPTPARTNSTRMTKLINSINSRTSKTTASPENGPRIKGKNIDKAIKNLDKQITNSVREEIKNAFTQNGNKKSILNFNAAWKSINQDIAKGKAENANSKIEDLNNNIGKLITEDKKQEIKKNVIDAIKPIVIALSNSELGLPSETQKQKIDEKMGKFIDNLIYNFLSGKQEL